MYGHAPLRWLRDGLEIGPGLVERWEANEDASSYTLYFRKGPKWSDGVPWTVDDVLFWWDDEVMVPDLNELPPDESRSGKNTPWTLTKLDDFTLQVNFDAPAPLTPYRIAMWVKRDPFANGGRWMDPKHYLARYHIKYNPALDPKTWADQYIQMREHRTNPECPVMTGWMLESVVPGQRQSWMRNPYYWAVGSTGSQLPYIDRLAVSVITDPEVMKLQVTNGQADYLQGNQAPNFTLADIQTLRQAEARSGLELRLWDSGSGTGSMYFFNYNKVEPKWRSLIHESRFRRALSLAFNRSQVQRAIYFNTGELTTGTLSPKALEYQVPGGKGVYEEWRDSAVRYDPDTAKRLLDGIGVIDVNRDGWREFPDGSPLEVTLEYAATASPTGDDVRKNEFLARDWQAVGVKTTLTPHPETGNAYDLAWRANKFLTRTDWEVGDGPNHLVYPQWLVPIEFQRWTPLNGTWYAVRGTALETQKMEKAPLDRQPPREAPEPGDPVDQLWQLYDQSKLEPDELKRIQLVWNMIKIHIQSGPFISGSVANPPRIVLVKRGLMNVPKRDDLALNGFMNPWIHPTPAVYDPESWYWDNPAAHA